MATAMEQYLGMPGAAPSAVYNEGDRAMQGYQDRDADMRNQRMSQLQQLLGVFAQRRPMPMRQSSQQSYNPYGETGVTPQQTALNRAAGYDDWGNSLSGGPKRMASPYAYDAGNKSTQKWSTNGAEWHPGFDPGGKSLSGLDANGLPVYPTATPPAYTAPPSANLPGLDSQGLPVYPSVQQPYQSPYAGGSSLSSFIRSGKWGM